MNNLKLPLVSTFMDDTNKNNKKTSNYGSLQYAYNAKNPTLSKNLHTMVENEKKNIEDYHNVFASELVKSIIFGGLDGIITSFSIISSGYASNLPFRFIILLGFSNVLADGISMGHGDYFSEKTENDFIEDQYKREKWEMENYPEGEISEMVNLYNDKYNIPYSDAEKILNYMAKYTDLFVDHMMVVELGLLPPENGDDWITVKKGTTTFISFVFFGCIPLTVLAISNSFICSILFCILTLGLLGWVRSYFTKSNRIYNCIITVINGCISASVAYALGYGLDKLLS